MKFSRPAKFFCTGAVALMSLSLLTRAALERYYNGRSLGERVSQATGEVAQIAGPKIGWLGGVHLGQSSLRTSQGESILELGSADTRLDYQALLHREVKLAYLKVHGLTLSLNQERVRAALQSVRGGGPAPALFPIHIDGLQLKWGDRTIIQEGIVDVPAAGPGQLSVTVSDAEGDRISWQENGSFTVHKAGVDVKGEKVGQSTSPEFRGSMSADRFSTDWHVKATSDKPGNYRITASLESTVFSGQTVGNTSILAEIALPTWKVEANLAPTDLQKIILGVQGTASAKLTASDLAPEPRVQFQVASLSFGSLLAGGLTSMIRCTESRAVIESLQLPTKPPTEITGWITWQQAYELKANLNGQSLASLSSSLKGTIGGQATLHGAGLAPNLDVNATVDDFTLREFPFGRSPLVMHAELLTQKLTLGPVPLSQCAKVVAAIPELSGQLSLVWTSSPLVGNSILGHLTGATYGTKALPTLNLRFSSDYGEVFVTAEGASPLKLVLTDEKTTKANLIAWIQSLPDLK